MSFLCKVGKLYAICRGNKDAAQRGWRQHTSSGAGCASLCLSVSRSCKESETCQGHCAPKVGNPMALVLRIGWKPLAFTSQLSGVGEDQNWQDRACLWAGSLETQTTRTSQGLIEIEIRSSHKQTWLLVTVMVTCQVVTQSSWLTESAYGKVVTSIVRERR